MKKKVKNNVQETLTKEFYAAIAAVLGDYAKKEDYVVTAEDIDDIARKVKFYLDLQNKEIKF